MVRNATTRSSCQTKRPGSSPRMIFVKTVAIAPPFGRRAIIPRPSMTGGGKITLPSIAPMPPIAPGHWPGVGSAPGLLRRPTEYLRRTRAALGDTFVADVFGYRLFFVFSAEGVRRLYALPETEGSFGLATFTLVFKHKIPLELAIGRRHRPHDLFGNQEVEGYLENLERAVAHELEALGSAGRLEGFTWARRRALPVPRGRGGGAGGRSPPPPRSAGAALRSARHLGLVRAPVARGVRDRDREADRAARDARDRGRDRRDPRRARALRFAARRLPAADVGCLGRRARARTRRAGG